MPALSGHIEIECDDFHQNFDDFIGFISANEQEKVTNLNFRELSNLKLCVHPLQFEVALELRKGLNFNNLSIVTCGALGYDAWFITDGRKCSWNPGV